MASTIEADRLIFGKGNERAPALDAVGANAELTNGEMNRVGDNTCAIHRFCR